MIKQTNPGFSIKNYKIKSPVNHPSPKKVIPKQNIDFSIHLDNITSNSSNKSTPRKTDMINKTYNNSPNITNMVQFY